MTRNLAIPMYASPAGSCTCGRWPDPGLRPSGGCWCAEESIVESIVDAAEDANRITAAWTCDCGYLNSIIFHTCIRCYQANPPLAASEWIASD